MFILAASSGSSSTAVFVSGLLAAVIALAGVGISNWNQRRIESDRQELEDARMVDARERRIRVAARMILTELLHNTITTRSVIDTETELTYAEWLRRMSSDRWEQYESTLAEADPAIFGPAMNAYLTFALFRAQTENPARLELLAKTESMDGAIITFRKASKALHAVAEVDVQEV